MIRNIKFNQVINIIDDFTLIIDYGSKNGAKVGEKLIVCIEGEEIKDLNGKELGILDIFKEDIEIIRVYENFSLCKHFEYETRKKYLLPRTLSENGIIKKISPMKVAKEEITNIKYESDDPIKKGDLVKIIK